MPLLHDDSKPPKAKTRGRKLCLGCDKWIRKRLTIGTGPSKAIEWYCVPCFLQVTWARLEMAVDKEFVDEALKTCSWGKAGVRPPPKPKKKGDIEDGNDA